MKRLIVIILLSNALELACISSSPDRGFSPAIWRIISDTSYAQINYNDSISSTKQYLLFSVIKSLSPDTSQLLWSILENNTMQYGILTDGSYSKHSGNIKRKTTTDLSYWNIFVYQQGCVMDSTKHYTLHIGSIDSFSSNIAVKEYLYFPTPLRQKQKLAIQTYLAIKYGITLDYAPYITTTFDTIWHHIDDAEYYNRIIGTGCDTVSLLYQKESKCASTNPLTIYHSLLEHGAYTLCGDNDKDLNWTMNSPYGYKLSRSWRVHSTKTPFILSLNLDYIPDADTVKMALLDDNGVIFSTIHADSIDRHGLLYFTLHSNDNDFSFWTNDIFTTPQKNRQTYASNSSVNNSTHFTCTKLGNMIVIVSPDSVTPDYYNLYDSAGKLIITVPAKESTTIVTPGDIPSGIYHIEAIYHNMILGHCKLFID